MVLVMIIVKVCINIKYICFIIYLFDKTYFSLNFKNRRRTKHSPFFICKKTATTPQLCQKIKAAVQVHKRWIFNRFFVFFFFKDGYHVIRTFDVSIDCMCIGGFGIATTVLIARAQHIFDGIV